MNNPREAFVREYVLRMMPGYMSRYNRSELTKLQGGDYKYIAAELAIQAIDVWNQLIFTLRGD